MTAIIKNNLRIKSAKDFLENFSTTEHDTARNHYLFIGKNRPWDDDLSPETPNDSIDNERRAWNDMLSCKKVSEAYVSLVIPRFDWDTTGDTIYTQYDTSDEDLVAHPTADEISDGNSNSYTAGSHYVITDESHIFKCMSNFNRAKSTVKPTISLTSPYMTTTADGYVWKYLATVTASQATRFLTDAWIPVATLGDISDDGSNQWDVEQNATDGSIDSYLVTNKGSGYTQVHIGTAQAGTTSTITLASAASSTNGHYVGNTVFITGGTGFGTTTPKLITGYVGSTRVATIFGTFEVTPTSSSTYDVAPTVTITGTGTGAIAKAVVQTSAGADQYKVVSVQPMSYGTAYRYATAAITGGGGAGAEVSPQVSPVNGHGFDIEKELGAFYAGMNVRLEFEEGAGDFPTTNDYRQIGLIRDLKNYGGTLASADTLIATKKMALTAIVEGLGGTFQADETVTSGSSTAYVVDFISTGSGIGNLTYIQNEDTGFIPFTSGTLTGAISGATATMGSITNEEIKKFDGDILYYENRRPVLRSNDLLEDIKIIIKY